MNVQHSSTLEQASDERTDCIEAYELYPVAGFICLVSYLAAALVR